VVIHLFISWSVGYNQFEPLGHGKTTNKTCAHSKPLKKVVDKSFREVKKFDRSLPGEEGGNERRKEIQSSVGDMIFSLLQSLLIHHR